MRRTPADRARDAATDVDESARNERLAGPDRPPATPLESLGCWGVGAALFALYGCLCARAPYLLDSAELASASFGLGVAHPPGEALALLWGKLFCLLPLGPVAFRVGLGQAAAAALAGALVYRLVLALLVALGAAAPARGARVLLATLGALTFGLAPGVLVSANRPEVYALQTALSVGALLLVLRATALRDPRPALAAGLLIGLGLANHPLVAGLTAVGPALAALTLLRPDAPRLRLVGFAIGAFFVGALVIIYVPLRAGALFAQAPRNGDVVVWGDARTLQGLFAVLSAETFRSKAGVVHGQADPGALPFAMMEELGPMLALLAPLGAWALARVRGARTAMVAAATTLAGAIGASLVGGFDPSNPDQRGYLGAGIATAAALAALALGAPLGRLRPRLQAGIALALCALPLARAPGVAAHDLRRLDAAARVVADELAALPPRAVLLSSYFQTAFLVGYARTVEAARPDVAHVHLGFVAGPGYAERLARVEPALAPFLTATQAAPVGRATLAALDGRPAYFEPDPRLAPDLRAALLPRGSLWSVGPAPSGGDTATRSTPVAATGLPEAAFSDARRDREARGFFAYRAFMDATLACAQGDSMTVTLRLQELSRLVPEDARARALAAGCPHSR